MCAWWMRAREGCTSAMSRWCPGFRLVFRCWIFTPLVRGADRLRVLIPSLPGALSAVGILLADTMREYSRTVMLPIDAPFEGVFAELEGLGTEDFRVENLTGQSFRSVDLRYKGQGYELNVPFGTEMAAQFHDLHQRRYGFANEMRALEVVNVRVRMVSAAEAFEPVAEPLEWGGGSQGVIVC